MLHISVQLEEKEDISYKRREFSFGKFKRSLQLSKEIDTDAIKAVYENGILRIELPKKTDLAKGNRNIVIE
jgi:HSP20 family protein